MFFILFLLFSHTHSKVDPYCFKTIKEYIKSFQEKNMILHKEAQKFTNMIDEIELRINKLDQQSIQDKSGQNLYLESIIGYIPLINSTNKIDISEFEFKRKKAIKLLSQGKLEQSYKKFSDLSTKQDYDPFSNYYWMGIIKLKSKQFNEAILHFGQFYKSMMMNKSHKMHKSHIDKMPRSIINILECLLNLKQKQKSLKTLNFFNTEYPKYRKSMHDIHTINQAQKLEEE